MVLSYLNEQLSLCVLINGMQETIMCDDKVVPINKKVAKKTDLERLHDALEHIGGINRVTIHDIFDSPSPGLMRALRDVIEISDVHGVDLADSIVTMTINYLNALAETRRWDLENQLTAFRSTLRNRFDLPDDDPLMVDLTAKIKDVSSP